MSVVDACSELEVSTKSGVVCCIDVSAIDVVIISVDVSGKDVEVASRSQQVTPPNHGEVDPSDSGRTRKHTESLRSSLEKEYFLRCSSDSI